MLRTINLIFLPPSATTTTFDYTLLLSLVQCLFYHHHLRLFTLTQSLHLGLVWLQNGHQDMYIAGTQAERELYHLLRARSLTVLR